MFEAPEVMRMAQDLARHSGARQSVIASNIANSDTPGFRARDITPFSDIYSSNAVSISQRQTREGHLVNNSSEQRWHIIDAGGTASPNGNTVSLEDEMVRATRASSNHTLALTVYRTSMDVLRTALGRGR